MGGGLLSYITPRLLIAFGVPLDDWIKRLPVWFNPEVVYWLFVAIIGAFILSLTYLIPCLISRKKRSQTDVSSPLKIKVQEDGNAYFRVEDEKRHSLQGSKRQVLSIKVHSKEAVDDVKIYISEIETSYDKDALQNLLPIRLNFKDANTDYPVSLSADESQQVDVVSYSSGLKACELELEQFGSEDNPKVFMYGSPFCLKIQIKIYGNNERLSQQSFEIYMKEPLVYNYASNSTQRIFMKRVSSEQQVIIDSQRKTIESLKEQQEPKLEVTFEKGKKPYLEPFRKTSPISKRDGQLYIYRIRVENTCSEIIKNVNVKLMKIEECPEGFSAEGCNLQFRHYPGVKAKDIQTEDDIFVDIIGYFDPYNKDIEKKEMYILHTEQEKLKSDIPVKKCDITIKINSDNGGSPITKHIKFAPTRKNIEDFMEMD